MPSNSKTMKLSKTGIKAVEKTGTVRAAALETKSMFIGFSREEHLKNLMLDE